MKALVALSVFLCFAFVGFGQYSKWNIQFTDKNNSPYSIDSPGSYLSPKAIARRNRYHISIDNKDLPVNPNYIQQVLSKGNITFLSETKCLNQILIFCTDSLTINSLKGLSFLKALLLA